MAPLRLAIIGYGMAGRTIHARLAREAGYSVNVIVVSNHNRRQQAATDWPGAKLVSDIEELIALRDRFDLAIIASPTSAHAENAALLARAGIPFVIDKPIGVDAFEARAVIAEAAKTKTPFTVFQNRRWDSEQLKLIDTIQRGQIGDIHTFERRWERWQPIKGKQWRDDDLVGGGLLLDLASHLVDSAIQLFGPVRKVTAEIRHLATAADDDVMLILDHAEGGGIAKSRYPVSSRLFAGSLVAAPGPRTKALGDKGAYVVTGFEKDYSAFEVRAGGKPGSALPDEEAAWIVQGTEAQKIPLGHSQQVDFYQALPEWLAGEAPAPVDPKDALRTAIVLDAARASAREGRTMTITLDGFK
jgi:predicted dehydrogenase